MLELKSEPVDLVRIGNLILRQNNKNSGVFEILEIS